MERFEREVQADLDYVADRRLHVSLLTDKENDDRQFIDVREFIVSLERYGRGLTMPIRMASDLADGVTKVVEKIALEAK